MKKSSLLQLLQHHAVMYVLGESLENVLFLQFYEDARVQWTTGNARQDEPTVASKACSTNFYSMVRSGQYLDPLMWKHRPANSVRLLFGEASLLNFWY